MKVIITGSTGMVGKGVLMECLKHPKVEQVLVINRSSLNMEHPKLKEILCNDFLNISSIKNDLKNYDACFHCMGVSSVGKNEEEYAKFTYSITKELADSIFSVNPNCVFNYVSGTGTDSTEKGKVMWARVKGKTENMVLNKGFKDAYMFRLGGIIPAKGIKSKTGWINILLILFKPLYPLMKKMKSITTSEQIGVAMINSVLFPSELKVLENPEVNLLAGKREL
ncbi:Uncharacterized conserved protein YbjT, contains NAD(P)-binding and DUF2867 domains [Lutibacter oricola]|uniref:Uncharacterized conserved protein YbjT, contains NAD(P)-binding and DUF2867 domains n=1 Tax=Lutibacter oricola TaxID=762486 RepID=A0A1H2QY83_9FLAO|nr:NAD-dependent epimerase/dehydratase family protein [Lutibacter oricola]SDW12123.1 Uncharacterized conserved protein YbjT, contains NAD(P)-binding and DUF2867 domains [Lutibacter oricola]